MSKKIILSFTAIILLIILLSGCASVGDSNIEPAREINIINRPITRQPINLPSVDRFQARPINYIILTPDNINAEFEKLKANGSDVVFFALTAKGYENAALNMSDILRLVQQQRSIIAVYQEYYEQNN